MKEIEGGVLQGEGDRKRGIARREKEKERLKELERGVLQGEKR